MKKATNKITKQGHNALQGLLYPFMYS